MAIEIQPEPKPLPRWRMLLSNTANYEVTKNAAALADKILATWFVIISAGGIAAKILNPTGTSLWFALAGISALGIGLVIYYDHYFKEKPRIAWRKMLLLFAIHISVVVIALVTSFGALIPHRPTLFSLWMSDMVAGFSDEGYDDGYYFGGEQVPFRYKKIFNSEQNTKFASFYIPDTTHTVEVSEYIAQNLGLFLNPIGYSFQNKAVGDAYGNNSSDLKFTGRIFIYHEADLSPEQITAIHDAFKKVGADVQLRGSDYMTVIGDEVMSGAMEQPPDYILKNGHPCRITPKKGPPATREGNYVHTPGGSRDYTDLPQGPNDPCKS